MPGRACAQNVISTGAVVMSQKPVMRNVESDKWTRKLHLRNEINKKIDVIEAERALMAKLKELLPDE